MNRNKGVNTEMGTPTRPLGNNLQAHRALAVTPGITSAQELLEARVRYENSRELRDRAERIYEKDAHAYDVLLLASQASGGTVDGA